MALPAPLTLLPFFCIFAGALTLFIDARVRPFASAVLILAAALGFVGGLVRIEGLVGIAAGAGLLWMQSREEMSSRARIAAKIALVLLALALALHRVPGFDPVFWLAGFGRDGVRPLVWQFDKAAAGLLILGLVGARSGNMPWQRWLPAVVAGALVMTGLALLASLAQWSPERVLGFAAWAVANLLIVALAEEAFFRGLLQNGLRCLLASRTTHAGTIAMFIAAVIFGLTHLPWGVGFACAAMLAGLFYGAAFRAGGLIAAVLAHALTNAFIVLLTHSALG
jgi:membrane protease YdiL (CAAX protease family)